MPSSSTVCITSKYRSRSAYEWFVTTRVTVRAKDTMRAKDTVTAKDTVRDTVKVSIRDTVRVRVRVGLGPAYGMGAMV